MPAAEEFVNGAADLRPNPEHGVEQIGAHPQVGHGPQILRRMPLLLQGILRRTFPQHLSSLHVQLHPLAPHGMHQGAGDHQPGAQLQKGCRIQLLLVKYQLQMGKGGAVIQGGKGHILGVPGGAHPAAHRNLPAAVCGVFK